MNYDNIGNVKKPNTFRDSVLIELEKMQNLRQIGSLHEGLGLLLEEFEEFKLEVFKKSYSNIATVKELAQISALCQRIVEDLALL